MAVISVEVPDTIAKRFKPQSVIQFDVLENTMYENSERTVVDFGSGVPVSEVLGYLKSK